MVSNRNNNKSEKNTQFQLFNSKEKLQNLPKNLINNPYCTRIEGPNIDKNHNKNTKPIPVIQYDLRTPYTNNSINKNNTTLNNKKTANGIQNNQKESANIQFDTNLASLKINQNNNFTLGKTDITKVLKLNLKNNLPNNKIISSKYIKKEIILPESVEYKNITNKANKLANNNNLFGSLAKKIQDEKNIIISIMTKIDSLSPDSNSLDIADKILEDFTTVDSIFEYNNLKINKHKNINDCKNINVDNKDVEYYGPPSFTGNASFSWKDGSCKYVGEIKEGKFDGLGKLDLFIKNNHNKTVRCSYYGYFKDGKFSHQKKDNRCLLSFDNNIYEIYSKDKPSSCGIKINKIENLNFKNKNYQTNSV